MIALMRKALALENSDNVRIISSIFLLMLFEGLDHNIK